MPADFASSVRGVGMYQCRLCPHTKTRWPLGALAVSCLCSGPLSWPTAKAGTAVARTSQATKSVYFVSIFMFPLQVAQQKNTLNYCCHIPDRSHLPAPTTLHFPSAITEG